MNILLSLALKRRYLCSLPGRMFFLSTRTYLFLSGRLCSWKKPTAWPSSWIMFPILHRSALLPIVSFWALSPPRPTREAQLVNTWVKQACKDNTCRCIQNFHLWINFNSIRCTAFRLGVVKPEKTLLQQSLNKNKWSYWKGLIRVETMKIKSREPQEMRVKN